MITRKRTRQIKIGFTLIGGDAPISVQSMTNTDTARVDETVGQIERLEAALLYERQAIEKIQEALAMLPLDRSRE